MSGSILYVLITFTVHPPALHPGWPSAGGLTWSVVQRFPGRFDKLAVMAPFPNMADDALTPATVIGKLNPATGEPFQPPVDSLIIDVRAKCSCMCQAYFW